MFRNGILADCGRSVIEKSICSLDLTEFFSLMSLALAVQSGNAEKTQRSPDDGRDRRSGGKNKNGESLNNSSI
jgi:hypothetical protein